MSTAPSPQLEAYLEAPYLSEGPTAPDASARAADWPASATPQQTETRGNAEWKQQVAERLAAHRMKKGRAGAQEPETRPDAYERSAESRVSRVAAAVAARYAAAPSYRDLLAAQAEAALRQAEAAAAAAASAAAAAASAEAARVAQQVLLAGFEDLELHRKASETGARSAAARHAPNDHANEKANDHPNAKAGDHANVRTNERTSSKAQGRAHERANAPIAIVPDLFPEQWEQMPPSLANANSASASSLEFWSGAAVAPEREITISDEEVDEWLAEHEEVFAGPAPAPVPLPTNLIEFPRQLVAPRKARPRLAEGPLREDSDAAPENAQLRIFEVEAAIIATAPPETGLAAAAEWASIRLDEPEPAFLPVYEAEQPEPASYLLANHAPQPAPLKKRLLSGLVDACLIGVGFAAFAAAFLATTTHPPSRVLALAASGVVLFAIAVMYFLLFFSLAESTPGMRQARIALCTFQDENPTRAAMRRRVAAMLLSALPLGLGYLWAWLDGDRLGWHDRLTRMYQRSY
ncbi:MAG: RDD family protein [Acidobacteriaceae bacterium]